MALKNQIDTQRASKELAQWLGVRMAGAEDVAVSEVAVPSSSGLSTETVLFEASWREGGAEKTQEMVARVQPDGPGVFPHYDLQKEARVMQALAAGSPVPAPTVLFHEDDASVLGAPFLVMERVAGRVPSDDPPFTAAGWVLELSPEQRGQLFEN